MRSLGRIVSIEARLLADFVEFSWRGFCQCGICGFGNRMTSLTGVSGLGGFQQMAR